MATSTFARALCALVVTIGGVQAAHSTVVTTPTGLLPGDQFRIAFLTVGTRNATSTNIADYDAFVNADAGSVTYNGQPVSFLAIGSTATVDAIDHIGQTTVPVYLNDGISKVTSSTTTSGLWSAALDHAINKDSTGAIRNPAFVWTGTNTTGTEVLLAGPASAALGSFSPAVGMGVTNFAWVNSLNLGPNELWAMYGISNVLSVPVPEPSTYALAAVGMVALLAIKRRKAQA